MTTSVGSMRHTGRVELSFANQRLREVCEDPEARFSEAKPTVIEALQARVADMKAADSPLDLIAGRPELIVEKKPRVVLTLPDSYALYSVANHVTVYREAAGDIDWSRVRRLKITAIRKNQR